MQKLHVVVSRSLSTVKMDENSLLAENYLKLILKEIETRRKQIKIVKQKVTTK